MIVASRVVDLDDKNLTDFQAIICVLTGNKETNHTQKEQMCCFFTNNLSLSTVYICTTNIDHCQPCGFFH